MAAKLEKTRTPGIFKRGSRYVFSCRTNLSWVSPDGARQLAYHWRNYCARAVL
jgi:hypothetical protein